jgi:serine/threonine protein kinase
MTPEVRQCLDKLSRGEVALERAERELAAAVIAGHVTRPELAKALEVMRTSKRLDWRAALMILEGIDRQTAARTRSDATLHDGTVHDDDAGRTIYDDSTEAFGPGSEAATVAEAAPDTTADPMETLVRGAPTAPPPKPAPRVGAHDVPVDAPVPRGASGQMGPTGTVAIPRGMSGMPGPAGTMPIPKPGAQSPAAHAPPPGAAPPPKASTPAADSEGTVPLAQSKPKPATAPKHAGAPKAGTESKLPNLTGSNAAKADADPGAEPITLRGRYRLEELMGQGAMGQVWKAKDMLAVEARDKNPFVAIKVLRGEMERTRTAFVGMHREASRAQKLAHPNVGTVYTLDRDEASGRAFIAMELLDGKPLDKFIKDRLGDPMPREEAMPILRGMAEGLAYAHKRGIVHCDFKPANVFLTRDGVPKILDFGIARAVQVADKSGAGLTTKGDDSVFMGFTPTYAAPDLIAENEPSTSDDVFSLGLVAYELLAGKHPFERKQADVAIKEGLKPVPLKGLKRNEWRAIEKALAYTRAERYPDGAAFVKDFVGRTPLQKTLIGALAASVLAASVFGWQTYIESQPTVPFESLPAEVQEQFKARVASGQESLDYVAKTGDVSASADAATFFAEAYALHPKNREAVRGLEQAADYAIPWFTQQPNRSEARAELEKFKGKSEFYNKYKPINEAIEDLK